MKYKFTYILIAILFYSCQFTDRFNGNEAIKQVQSQKFGIENTYKINLGSFIKNPDQSNYTNLVANTDPTNLEVANSLAVAYGNDNFEWQTKYEGDGIYLVLFFSTTANQGIIWEANVDSQVVRCVTCDPQLMKKYNLPMSTITTEKPKHKRHK